MLLLWVNLSLTEAAIIISFNDGITLHIARDPIQISDTYHTHLEMPINPHLEINLKSSTLIFLSFFFFF